MTLKEKYKYAHEFFTLAGTRIVQSEMEKSYPLLDPLLTREENGEDIGDEYKKVQGKLFWLADCKNTIEKLAAPDQAIDAEIKSLFDKIENGIFTPFKQFVEEWIEERSRGTE